MARARRAAFTKETSSHLTAGFQRPASRSLLHVPRLPRLLYFAVFVRFIVHAFKATFQTVNLHSLFLVQMFGINIIFLQHLERLLYMISCTRVKLWSCVPLFLVFFLLIFDHFGFISHSIIKNNHPMANHSCLNYKHCLRYFRIMIIARNMNLAKFNIFRANLAGE